MSASKSRLFLSTTLLGASVAFCISPAFALPYGDEPGRSYDDSYVRLRAAQYSVDRDRAELDAARQRVAQISEAEANARDALNSLRRQLDSRSDLPPTAGDLTLAQKDQAAHRAKVLAAQHEFESAKANVDKIHAAALARFESTEAFKAAFAPFDQARQDLKGPTDAVLEELAKTRDFQDRVAAARTARENERKLQDDKNADPKAVEAAHDAFVAADARVQDLEEAALTADPKVIAARHDVDRARAVLVPMRDKFEDDLRQNATFSLALSEARHAEADMNRIIDDQKRIDDQVARMASAVDPAANPRQLSRDELRSAVRAAERKLDGITFDLDHAKLAATAALGRLRDDEEGLYFAQRDRDDAADAMGYQPGGDFPPVLGSPADFPPIAYLAPACLPACPAPLAVCYTPCWDDGFYGGISVFFAHSSFGFNRDRGRDGRSGGYYRDTFATGGSSSSISAAQAAYEARVGRRNADATAAYESRVSRRATDASSAAAADRAAYEARVARRAQDAAAQPQVVNPNVSRISGSNGGPSFVPIDMPRSSRGSDAPGVVSSGAVPTQQRVAPSGPPQPAPTAAPARSGTAATGAQRPR